MVAPLAIDMVPPAMPAIASETTAQDPISVYLLTFDFAYLANGPWAVMSGRKSQIQPGLVVFAPGFMGAALVPCWARLSWPAALAPLSRRPA